MAGGSISEVQVDARLCFQELYGLHPEMTCTVCSALMVHQTSRRHQAELPSMPKNKRMAKQ